MKKIISCLILCAMLLSVLPMSVFASTDEGSNTRTPVSMSTYLDGNSGYTKDDFDSIELTIGSADELEKFNNSTSPHTNLKNAYIKLTADIDYTDKTWKGIIFDGTFDGNGYTINNITVGTCSNAGGMFRYAGGTIKNLTVNVLNCEQTIAHVGGIVGSRANSNVYSSDLTIDNVHIINGTVVGTTSVGGILGNTNGDSDKDQNVTIRNCSFNGTVSATTDNVGGIVGYGVNVNSLSLSKCSVSLEDSVGEAANTGSLVGQTKIPTTLQNCIVAPSENNPTSFVTATNVTVDTSTCFTKVSDARYYGFQSKTESGLVDYRVIGALDSDNLSAVSDVGFYVTLTYNGVSKAQKVSCKSVYSSVVGGGITYTTDDNATASATIEKVDGDYLFAIVISDVPTGVEVSADFTAYKTDSNGTVSCGATQSITLSETKN